MEKIAHKLEEKERTSDIKLKENVPFSKMLLNNCVRKGLNEAGFIYPTNTQASAIPLGKVGIDLIIQSKSGTGKTLIFCTILLENYQNNIHEPQSLILVPTREIALQTEHTLMQFGKFCPGFKVVSIIGGLDITKDRKNIQGAKAIVGTPGRVLHLIKNEVLNITKIRLLILDEADKLMSKSIRGDLLNIISNLSAVEQTIACSATFCNDLDQNLTKFMRNPLLISTEKRSTVLIGIKQFVHDLSLSASQKNDELNEFQAKLNALIKIFSQISFNQCIVFTCSPAKANKFHKSLQMHHGWPCESITSAQNQKTRIQIFQKFRESKIRILISTDLMSRGIDLENVNLVINLDVPTTEAIYLHRIGRAGRFGSKGIAITFLWHDNDKLKFSQVLNNIRQDMNVLKLPIDNIPDLWDFTNLEEEQENFGLFERLHVEDEIYAQNNTTNNMDNGAVSHSSSSNKQISVNAATLDDASSLAVDSDIHFDTIDAEVGDKKTSKRKSKKSKKRRKRRQSNQEMNEQKKKSNFENFVSDKQNYEKTENTFVKPTENSDEINTENDDACESQSDVGNSSGGDTRTIIDFKSLVVDKDKNVLKPVDSGNIFADYETFNETNKSSKSDSNKTKPKIIDSLLKQTTQSQMSSSSSKSAPIDCLTFNIKTDEKKKTNETASASKKSEVQKKLISNDVFDDYDEFNKKELKSNCGRKTHKELGLLSLPNESNNTSSIELSKEIEKCNENSSESQDIFDNGKFLKSLELPKVPNPSPKDGKNNDIPFSRQIDLHKLQVQNLPSFNLMPDHKGSDLVESDEDESDSDDVNDEDDYNTTTEYSLEENTRSSGFDEKTTSLGSSGIVTSTNYSESTSEGSYRPTENYDDENESNESNSDADDEEYITSSDNDSILIDKQNNFQKKEDSEQKKFIGKYQPQPIPSTSTAPYQFSNLPQNDFSAQYRYAQTYWRNMYYDQLTLIKDYVNFHKYIRKNRK